MRERNLFLTSAKIETACGTKERYDNLKSAFNDYYNIFANEHVIDTYVFCLSEHVRDDADGLLSMWRGYGGNGNGAAIVFDSAKLSPQENSPLIIAKVEYGSTEERINWLQKRVTQFAEILGQSNIPDDKLYLSSYLFFERLKLFAVFTKHRGFSEESEWRVVYMRDRDRDKMLDRMFGYRIGPHGVEPKLKLKIEHIPGLTGDDVSLSKIVERVILRAVLVITTSTRHDPQDARCAWQTGPQGSDQILNDPVPCEVKIGSRKESAARPVVARRASSCQSERSTPVTSP